MQEGFSNPYQKGGLKSAHNWFKHCKKSDYSLKIIEIWRPSITCDAKFYLFILERDFIFERVKTGQTGTWSLVE